MAGPGHRTLNPRALWLAAAFVAAALIALAAARLGPSAGAADSAAVWYDYRVVNVYPHDPGAFTQGLLFRDGQLYESTGLYGQSSLRRVRLDSGEVIRQRLLDPGYFGEGLTDWGNRLVQLTWRSNTGFIYDIDSFALLGTFSYPGEGWGLTNDGRHLIMSDGTAELRFLDPETFEERRRVTVTDDGQPVENLNELALINGEVFANVWQRDEIVIIDPDSGKVTGWIDMRGLLPPAERARVDVLNGIAYDADGDRLFVTGKFWPSLFEIRLEARR